MIGASSLRKGIEYVRDRLGIDLPPGGQHHKMGTHNRVMRIGNAVFLEVIAIDPNLPAPSHPRWFGLDDPFIMSRLLEKPRILTWVVNSSNISTLPREILVNFGNITSMNRDDLDWLITIRPDGSLPLAGLLPTIIQWNVEVHPVRNMAESGCSIKKILIYHRCPKWVRENLEAIRAEHLVEICPLSGWDNHRLEIYLETPRGVRVISSEI